MIENICLMTFFDYIMHGTIKDVDVVYSVIMLVKTVHESYCIVLLLICLRLCFQVRLVEPGYLERSQETMLNRFNKEETMAQIRPLQCLLCRANEAPHL